MIRGVLKGSAVAALAVVTVACSGGNSRVSAGPGTTHPAVTSSPTTATSTSGSTKAVSKSPTTKAPVSATTRPTTATTRGTSPTTVLIVTPTTVTVVQQGSGQTVVSVVTPTTARPRPTTTTTIPGPKPYDPSKPIDLSGTPGVTAAEQHRAEQLIRDTLRDLPRYASTAAAYAAGYRSIGDSLTGDEHYINWAYADDSTILDSKHPESLVYNARVPGVRTLEAAMYSMPPLSRFSDVPDVGGALTQWHVHDDLCLIHDTTDPLRWFLWYGLVPVNSPCPPGTVKKGSVPMLHVWIVKNPCGPFSALDGLGAGQVPAGQTQLCDTAHGSG